VKKCEDSDKIPTPNRLKKAKEENKSIESSSKVSLFPAVHTDNKDALKNILNSINYTSDNKMKNKLGKGKTQQK
jgi:hypothetical protein